MSKTWLELGYSVKMKMALIRSWAVLAFVVMAYEPAIGAENPVTVTVDRAKVFRIDEAASTVVVGNPFIADVALHDRFTVVVTGKSYGSTNLVILDDKGSPIIDEVITVRASEDNIVSVTRNAARQTYSCAPHCEPVLRVGDNKEIFDSVAGQATIRNKLAEEAAGISN
jgi:Flp pilus assembly secretin CpaC